MPPIARIFLPLLLILPPLGSRGAVVEVGSRRELLVDRLLIERLDGLTQKLHEPRPAGVAIRYDGPLEDRYSFYTTVLKDGDRYRMYYRGYLFVPGGAKPGATDEKWSEAVAKAVTCYAESRDGINWVKPRLGLVEVNGSRDNNVILAKGDQFCPFVDERPGVAPAERYKANAEGRGVGLMGYVSADGLNWRLVQEQPIVPAQLKNHFDSQNVIFWSEVEQCYVLYARHMVGGKRATARSTSADFRAWTPQTLMTYSDTGLTTPSQHFYTNQTTPYFRAPHLYIALAARFQEGRRALTEEQARRVDTGDLGGGVKDISDGVFFTSRAGTTRYDFTLRESFIRPGVGPTHWVSRTNYPALGVVPTGPAEMSMYVQRDYGQKSAYLERLTLRTDGFISVHAPYDGGEMLTPPLRFTGKELEINLATSAAGGLRVEIQNEAGQPLPGYTLDDCPEMIGDEIGRVVSWKGGSDVSALSGRAIRLRFAMKDADLYSIQFRP